MRAPRSRLIALVPLLLLAAGAAPLRAEEHPRPLVDRVAATGFTVSDADRSADFFTRVLGFRKDSDTEVAGPAYESLTGVFGARMRVVRMRLGQEALDLTQYLAPRGRPVPQDSRANDRSFQHVAIVVRDMDQAYTRLRQHRVEHASTGPQRLPDWNKNAGGIRAFYFRDPDGHFLELIWFPPGKGDPRWQRGGSELFLGVDHTAIVVADTDASLRFYQGTLGLRIAGESENHGTEQEHLNNVFGARLRITALRAAAGPGIELLEYLTPRGGRPMPPDEGGNDLFHWQTQLVAGRLVQAATALRASRAAFVSPDVVSLPDGKLGFRKGERLRDPDGHVMELVQP